MESTSQKCAQESISQSLINSDISSIRYSIESPIVDYIESHAENFPEKIALSYGQQHHSYRALVADARIIANGLKKFGVSPQSRVSVLMYPCPELVCCLLGIHMLGASYVPIDPAFPKSRIGMILEDIAPSAVVFLESHQGLISDAIPADFLCKLTSYEQARSAGIDGFEGFQKYPLSIADESHIFFTSGTTGRPKGAISSHKNLAHGMLSSIHCFELNNEHEILSVAGASFSISTFELLALLTCGGRTVIAQRSDILDVHRLFDAARKVNVWHLVPTLLARLIEYVEQSPERVALLYNLERILTGGDNVPPSLLTKIRQLLPNVKLYVNYGASETNCMVTYWPVFQDAVQKTKIGGPQKNVHLLVLDKHRKPVKNGDIGELFVASPGVIIGYLHRSDLNDTKFIEQDGLRYFSTGDMVREDQHGQLEMLGREDFQIQLNGHRIELLEIESTIKRSVGIKDCVVAAKVLHSGTDQLTLIAYVVMDSNQVPSVHDLKAFLSEYLPGYMVPSLYLLIEKIPTNHNGKVDRVNLPDPNVCRILQTIPEEALNGPIEQRVATIWKDLLLIDSIHANSNFFELGGDSISAVRAMAMLSAEFGCNITIGDIIAYPTVKQISLLIIDCSKTQLSGPERKQSVIPGCLLLKKGKEDLAPLLLLNGLVEYLELAKALHTERSIYAIYLPEEIDLIVNGERSKAVESTNSIASISQLYVSIITALQPNGPYYLIGKSYGGIIAIEAGNLLAKMGHKIAFTGLLDTVVPDAFIAHRKIAFRVVEHLKRTISEGPSYLAARLSNRFRKFSRKNPEEPSGHKSECSSNNIQVRHKVRKNAIFNTQLSSINRPLMLIKARDRKYLYGEKPSRDLGWNKYCHQLTVNEVPGDHHSILMEKHVNEVARHIEMYVN